LINKYNHEGDVIVYIGAKGLKKYIGMDVKVSRFSFMPDLLPSIEGTLLYEYVTDKYYIFHENENIKYPLDHSAAELDLCIKIKSEVDLWSKQWYRLKL